MKTWMSLLVCLVLFAVPARAGVAVVALPTFLAIAKHPVGDGRFMLVVPGYKGLPVYVNAADQVIGPPPQVIAAPTSYQRMPDGSILYTPLLNAPVLVNPQPAYILFPSPLRTLEPK